MSAYHEYAPSVGVNCVRCGLPKNSRIHERPLDDAERAFAETLGIAAAEDIEAITKRCASMAQLDGMPGIKPGMATASIHIYLEIVRRALDELEAGRL